MTKKQARDCFYAGAGNPSDSLGRMALDARFEEWWKYRRRSKQTDKLQIPKHVAAAVRKYLNTDWSKQHSKLGGLNAVAYIGEQIVDAYRRGE